MGFFVIFVSTCEKIFCKIVFEALKVYKEKQTKISPQSNALSTKEAKVQTLKKGAMLEV